jgi:hypothetical protein
MSSKLKVVNEFIVIYIIVQYFVLFGKTVYLHFRRLLMQNVCISYKRNEDPQIIFGILFGPMIV